MKDTTNTTRHHVSWPEKEPIPQSVEEALAMGWELDGEYQTAYDGERSHTGTAWLWKNVGPYELSMDVPFRAEYTFEKPHSPVAIIDEYVYDPEVGFVPRFRQSPGIQ